MKRQKLFAVLAAAALIFTSFGCKNDDGSDGSGDSVQPEYVGKIYSAKDGKTWLKIDSEEMATLAVWEDGTAVQSASRAAATTGSYIFRQGKYTISIKDGNDIFSLKLEWTQNGKSYSYEIVADLTNGTTLANFKINGKTVDWEQTTAAPEKPAADSSTSGGSSSGETGGNTSGGSSSEEEPDYSNIPVPEGFVRVPGVSIKGDETWTPESKVFVSGRKLKITSFFMSDHEVTRKEYKDIIGNLPMFVSQAYDNDGNKITGDAAGNCPVDDINWYAAIVYCNKRSVKEGLKPCYTIKGSTNPDVWGDVPEDERNAEWDAATCDFTVNGYRLPTEAEWEWAARGGESYTYAGSNDIADVCWYSATTKSKGSRPVKAKKANGYGLYDMSGNVWEWCWDIYDCDIVAKTPVTGPVATEDPVSRIPRGGSYGSMNIRCEVGAREDYYNPWNSLEKGFRVVRTIK